MAKDYHGCGTIDDNGKRRYGDWAGNPKGVLEDKTKCIKEVWPTSGYIPYQCNRKRGHGAKGLFCKQHAKEFLDEEKQ
jgi:hypothetical protein